MASAQAVVEQFLDAAARHDLEGMLAVLAEDAYFVPSGQEFDPSYGDFSGHEGWRRWWAAAEGARLSLDSIAIEQLDDHRVVAEFLIGKTTGNSYEGVMRVGVYTVHDSRITAVEIFTNPDIAYQRVRSDGPEEPSKG